MIGKTLFFFLLFSLPVQKKHKIFKSVAAWMNSGFSFPLTFQKNLYFYLSDLALIAFAILLFGAGLKACQSLWRSSAKYLTLVFIASGISLVLSMQSSCLLHYMRLTHFGLFLFFFCLMEEGRIFHEIEKSFLKVCTYVLFLSLFESGVACAQYFCQSDLGLQCLGAGKAIKAFYSSSNWHFGSAADGETIMRAMGTFLHANIFGGFIAATVPLTYCLFWQSKIFFTKLVYGVAIFLQVFALFLSFSRAALLAWVIMSGCWLFFCVRKKIVEGKNITTLLIVVVVSALLCLGLLFPALKERGGIVNYNTLVKESDQGRILYQNIAWKMVKKYPLTGVGYNQYVVRMQEFCPHHLNAAQLYPVHNIYFLVAAETGCIGCLCLLLFIGSILKRALACEMTLSHGTLLSIFIGLLFIGCCDYYLWSSQAGKLLFFITAALLSRSSLVKIRALNHTDKRSSKNCTKSRV